MNKYNPQAQINFTITRDGQEIYTETFTYENLGIEEEEDCH